MNDSVEIERIDLLPPAEIEYHNAGTAYIGKDILELLSISMYVDPLVVFREYIQNATDAIDEACGKGLLPSESAGNIHISLSQKDRSIVILDNGCGINNADFEALMLSFGASLKRGKQARGFRGVGRFSGLAFCQNLIFRTKVESEDVVSQIEWDGRKFRDILQDESASQGLEELVSAVATVTTYNSKRKKDHFFEVELQKVVRTKNDMLLDEGRIERYLAQTSPVPYSEEFTHKSAIQSFLGAHGIMPGYSINLTSDHEDDRNIFRPYLDEFSISDTVTDTISGIQKFSLEGVHDGASAIGWIFEHNYKGVIPRASNIRGIRVRQGNIQIGDDAILAETFPEVRFNSWSMGEVHILDRKISPNGRRDNFVHSVHWLGVQNKFSPIAKNIAKECRRSSSERNIVKHFYSEENKARHIITLIKQGALSKARLKEQNDDLVLYLLSLEKATRAPKLTDSVRSRLIVRYKKIQSCLKRINIRPRIDGDFIESLPRSKRPVFREVFDLVYECSSNKVIAKALLDKIMETYTAKTH